MRSIVAASNKSVAYSRLPDQPALALGQAHGQIELRSSAADPLDPPHVETRQAANVRMACSAVPNDRLEQRIARQIALRRQLFHQLLERQVLVRIGVQRTCLAPAPGKS